MTDAAGLPVAFRITPDQGAECAQANALLEGREADAVAADKGCELAEIVAKIQSPGTPPSSRCAVTGS